MKKITWLHSLPLIVASLAQAEVPQSTSGDISFPADYKDFRLIALSQRSDDQTLRVILGNNIAVEAARSGKTNPWPNGAILAKLGWKHKQSPVFPTATLPDTFTSTAIMIKDTVKYAATGGWGWGEWNGLDKQAYNKSGFAHECVACHTKVKDQDLVFTRPAPLP